MKTNLPKIYLDFIENCKTKNYDGLFTHKHHILPKFMGGTNECDNLIVLSVEDHFMAHKILAENCDDGYKSAAAASLNLLHKYWHKSVGESYDDIRELISISLSGANNGMYGKTHSAEVLKKLSEYTTKYNPMKSAESVEKVRISKIGKIRSDLIGDKNPVYRDGVIDKIKKSLSEFHQTDAGIEYRNKMSIYTTNNHPLKSNESRRKLATSLKNRYENLAVDAKNKIINNLNKYITCDECGKTTNIGNYTRWHKNNKCKIK